MPETDFSFSHIEHPAPGSQLPQGRHLLRGWVWPRPGGHFADVRARVDDRIFPGVHGLPRADLAVHFKTGRAFALAEFSVAVDLPPGRTVVALEVLEIEGRWSTFEELTYDVLPSGTPAAVPAPGGPLRWHEYGRALRCLLRALRAQPDRTVADLAAELVGSIPFPRELRQAPADFRGYLDEPAALTVNGFGRTPVGGYLFHLHQPISRVLATFDLQAWQQLEMGRPAPGPAAFFPGIAQARHSGIYGLIDTPAQLPTPVSLRLYAELADGSLHLCQVQRSRLTTREDEKRPYPGRDRCDFGAVCRAFDEACRRAGVEFLHDGDLAAETARVADEFTRWAPAKVISPAPLQPAPAGGTGPLPQRVLLVTHNLNREGAPLFLLDLARHLRAHGCAVTVLSPAPGPLQLDLSAAGCATAVLDVADLFRASDDAGADAALAAVGRGFDFSPFDLVVANTFTTFWAVHAAAAARRPVLMYVHESTTPALFYHDRASNAVVQRAVEAFALADVVSFTTAATRSCHADYGRPDRHRLTPGWIDVGRIDAWRAAHPRAGLRARFALAPETMLVTNVGTVCDRKGQHVFARAVDLLWRRDPELAARSRFIMLGGGDTPFDAMLQDLLVTLGHSNLVVHPATADYLPYYAAADLLVCSTYEEASPRVILEAMACETPILSSAVHGVPEQVRPDLEAILVPPGDTVALCEGMIRLLRSPASARTLAQRARARVVREFDAGILLPRHAALAASVANAGRFGSS